MENQYYIRLRGKILGPFDQEKLRSLARRGQFSRIYEVSEDGMTWVPAATYPGLFSDNSGCSLRNGTTAMPQSTYEGQCSDRLLQNSFAHHNRSWFSRHSRKLAIGLVSIAALSLIIVVVWLVLNVRNSNLTSEGENSVAKSISEDNAATNMKVTEEKGTASNRIADIKNNLAKMTVTEKKATKENISVGKDAITLASIKDHMGIANAVGKVVVGREYTTYEGKIFQVPTCVGSAFAINHDGAMLTNKHVVEPYIDLSRASQRKADLLRENKLTLHEMLWVFIAGNKYNAKLVYISPKHDYAILQIERSFDKFFGLKLSSNDLLDTEVRAIGFPGVASTGFSEQEIVQDFIKKKIILHADVTEDLSTRDLQYVQTPGRVSQVTNDSVLQVTWLQHTADIAGGNSGGPLVLQEATVLGINTLIVGDKEELGAQFFRALFLGQFRADIDRHVPGVVWVP